MATGFCFFGPVMRSGIIMVVGSPTLDITKALQSPALEPRRRIRLYQQVQMIRLNAEVKHANA